VIFDFDFKSFWVDDFDFDFKIILRLIYDFKPSKYPSKSSNLASFITGSRTAVTYLAIERTAVHRQLHRLQVK